MKKAFPLSDIVRIAVMAALIAVCSWLTVTIPFISEVPFTLQTFAVFFALEFAAGRNGTISILIYLLLGAVGVPVFSGFRGGIGHLLGPTGGYIVGFLLTGIIFWIFDKKFGVKSIMHYVILAAGLLACYACGTVWFTVQMSVPVGTALLKCVLPYIIPDVIKIGLAVLLASRLKKIIKV